ncbi:hypothetical protein GRS48_11310 [Halorubrum sp. JWXQ-INN 858]|uniref:hypothetical protein n=1 Tax=Halorubrum sp. JWXQ-INN 858 TaxID=2690782 RepID=UPI0013574F6C|nr:hypothetical protein [Halorubrum sp. JWXQ-INN 858]MWV65399.1 hypothetical protein [Halorubrum sp. JWXQ-INN 858]
MTGDSTTPTELGVLTVGFLAFTVAVVAAYTTPAAGYELSIYRATPVVFWIGIGIGLLAAVTALFVSGSGRLIDAAMVLAAFCVLAVVAIPVLRSYAYYGAGDSLSHLGWAREIRGGVIQPQEVLYPGDHLIAITLSSLTGLDLAGTLQIVATLLFPLVYLLAMPLCVGYITNSRWGATVGFCTALLLIPINKISLHVVIHPSSQAILFVPFVLFLLFRYLYSDGDGFGLTTPMGAAFTLAAVALVFIHPQETMTFLTFLVALVVLQFVIRRSEGDGPIARHRGVGVHTLVVGAAFFAWTLGQDRAVSRFEGVIEGFTTSGATTGTETAERGTSLVALGGSFEELFVKLFAVSLVFCLLAGGLMLLNFSGKLDARKSRRNAAITYLTAGLVPVSMLFVVIFLANQGDHYFRFLGTIMVLVTVVGAVSLTVLLDRLDTPELWTDVSVSRSQVVGAVVVVIMLMLAAQLVVVHQAPYMYQPNKQVTASDFTGHEVAIEYHDDETELLGLRSGQRRYLDAHFGRETTREMDFPGYGEGVTGEVFSTNLTTHYEDDRYLVIADRDEDREITLYDELRYTADGFERLDRDHRVNRVQDNGNLRLYRISGTASDA